MKPLLQFRLRLESASRGKVMDRHTRSKMNNSDLRGGLHWFVESRAGTWMIRPAELIGGCASRRRHLSAYLEIAQSAWKVPP